MQTGYDSKIKRITAIGAAVNVSLALIKAVFGLLFGSLALVADGLHSLADLFTDMLVYIGVGLSSRSPDQQHPYGHKWYETLTTIAIACVLIIGGIIAIYKSVDYAGSITDGIGQWLLISAASVSIIAKEALYRATRKTAAQTKSSVLYANAWHHRSDALSSVAVLCGLAAHSLGFEYGDQLATVAVGTLVIAAGIKLLAGCFKEFTNAAVDEQTLQAVEAIVNSNPAINQMHKLRSRTIGHEIFLDFHILVDPNLNVSEAHKISCQIENDIKMRLELPVNIIVHIEPDEPQCRK